jgi:hypothetical protein
MKTMYHYQCQIGTRRAGFDDLALMIRGILSPHTPDAESGAGMRARSAPEQ